MVEDGVQSGHRNLGAQSGGIAMSTCSNDDSSDIESVIESEDRAMQERNTAQIDAISIGSAELV